MFISKEEQRILELEYSEKFSQWLEGLDDFVMVPNDILFSDQLTDGQIIFFIKLTALSDRRKGVLYHSNETLAEELKCTTHNIKKFLDSLKKKNAIKVLSTGIHKKRVICLTPWNLL